MMLAGTSAANVFALIDRGIAADDTFPAGTAYLLRTADAARSVRWPSMEQAAADWNHAPDGIAVVYRDDSASGTGVAHGRDGRPRVPHGLGERPEHRDERRTCPAPSPTT